MSVTTHPTPETLTAFARGDLPPDELSSVAEHVGACESCCAALRAIPDDTIANLARAAATPQAPTPGDAGDLVVPPPLSGEAIPPALADHSRYKIVGELGAGGMGVVYKAYDQVMDRHVALKVMAAHLTAKPGAVERFNKEVRAAARLEHQNIVRAYDKGEAGNLHFLVMEYVEGISLDRYLVRKGQLTVALACTFARHAANGLQHAAERGLTHRDIKPQNLMVPKKGQLKVMDFGLARFVRNDADEEPSAPAGRLPFGAGKPVSDPLTNPNLIMGTPDYLSPEQARNSHTVDHRSDIYSLGCTLYFMLAGRPPFAHESSLIDKLLGHTEKKPPSIRKFRSDVPAGLVAVLAKMMAKKPDERYQTAADVAAALSPFTRADAGPEVVEAVVVAPVRSTPKLPPLPEPTRASAKTRPEISREADTSPVPDGPTLVEEERPRKTRKAKKSRVVPWWKRKWAVIGAVALLGLIVAIAIASRGKKDTQSPPGGGDGSDSPGANPGTGGPVPKGKQNPEQGNPFRPGQPGQGTANSKTLPLLYVLPSKGLYGQDYFDVVRPLTKGGGVKVVTASGSGTFVLENDPSQKSRDADKKLADVEAADYAGIVFCGLTIDEYIKGGTQGEKAGQLIADMRKQKKPVTAICVGVGVLASHGVLNAKRAARSHALEEHYPRIASSVAAWLNEDVVFAQDGGEGSSPIITASGPEHAEQFAAALRKILEGK